MVVGRSKELILCIIFDNCCIDPVPFYLSLNSFSSFEEVLKSLTKGFENWHEELLVCRLLLSVIVIV